MDENLEIAKSNNSDNSTLDKNDTESIENEQTNNEVEFDKFEKVYVQENESNDIDDDDDDEADYYSYYGEDRVLEDDEELEVIENQNDDVSYDNNENIVAKYNLIREKIIKHYKKGCQILTITKFMVGVGFIIFTLIGVKVASKTEHVMFWLVLWVALILTLVGIFLLTDYAKYLISSKVIPYLEDDYQIEFGEYSIFVDNDDEDEEELEEEEDD